jgi:hypothetical protein
MGNSIASTLKCGGCKTPKELGESGNADDKQKAKDIEKAQNCARKCTENFNNALNSSPMSESTKNSIEKWFRLSQTDPNYEANLAELRKRVDKINSRVQSMSACFAEKGKGRYAYTSINPETGDHYDDIVLTDVFFDRSDEARSGTIIHEATHAGLKDYEKTIPYCPMYSHKGDLGTGDGKRNREYYYDKEKDGYYQLPEGTNSEDDYWDCSETKEKGYWEDIWEYVKDIPDSVKRTHQKRESIIKRESLTPAQAMSLPDAYANAIRENCDC